MTIWFIVQLYNRQNCDTFTYHQQYKRNLNKFIWRNHLLGKFYHKYQYFTHVYYLLKITGSPKKYQKIETFFINIVCQMEFFTRYRRYSHIHSTSMETVSESWIPYRYRNYYHNRLSEKVERDKSNVKARTISMIVPSSETNEIVDREFAKSPHGRRPSPDAGQAKINISRVINISVPARG